MGPEFRPTFQFDSGERIFTIGSCFAREVEDGLLKRGFQIPVRAFLDKEPEFATVGTEALNNYGTPSIFNELSWALGPDEQYIAKDHLLELRPGKFVDIHLTSKFRPAAWDVVFDRRKSLINLMRQAIDCRIVIITLGLAEVWYDTQTGCYLNDTPLPSLLNAYPGRFEFHVLSYQEAYDYLERALNLLRTRTQRDLRVVLTVY